MTQTATPIPNVPDDPMAPRFYFGDLGAEVKCKCPQCEKIHSKQLWWTGRGMPRIVCNYCIREEHRARIRHATR